MKKKQAFLTQIVIILFLSTYDFRIHYTEWKGNTIAPKLLNGWKICELPKLLTPFTASSILVNDRCSIVKPSIIHQFLRVNPLSLCLIFKHFPFS